jgi:hypothetical protein
VQLYRYFVSQYSEFCRHNPLCCFSTSNTKGKLIFRYRLTPETFGYIFVFFFLGGDTKFNKIQATCKALETRLSKHKWHYWINIYEKVDIYIYICTCILLLLLNYYSLILIVVFVFVVSILVGSVFSNPDYKPGFNLICVLYVSRKILLECKE